MSGELLDDVQTPARLAGAAYEGAVRSKAAELKRELIRQTLEDIESWGKAVDDQWNQAHPGQAHLSPTTTEEFKQYVSTVQNSYYDWVEPAFERYLAPDPDAINPMIDALRQIEGMFQGSADGSGNTNFASPALARTHDVRADMGKWEGGFQEDFIDNFLTPLETVSLNQAALAKAVRSQLVCGKGMYIEYRDGILKLLDTSIEAVQLLNNQRDPKPCMWGTLVGIALGTALTLGTGGLAATGVVLIIGSTLAQGVIPDPPKHNDLAAPTAQEVAVNITKAMGAMDTDISANEQSLKTAFDNIANAVSDARSGRIASNTSGPLSVATPRMDGATPSQVAASLRPSN